MLTDWCWLIHKGKKITQSDKRIPAGLVTNFYLNIKPDKLVDVFEKTISDPKSIFGVSTFNPAFGGVLHLEIRGKYDD